MSLLIGLLKIFINITYFFLKLLPVNEKKVVFISRQANHTTLDFRLLGDEIKKIDPNYELVFLCNRVKKNFRGMIDYFFLTLKHLYHLATSRVCVIDSYCLAVSVPKHRKSLVVIQIWHAIATVKKFGYQTLEKSYGRDKKMAKQLHMHQNYSWVISGSDAMRKVFSETFHTDVSKVKSVGTPRVDYLLRGCDPIDQIIIKKYPLLNHKKVILYAPTFRKDEDIKIDELVKTIDFNKYNLVIKTHPVKKQHFSHKGVYNCSDFSTMQLLTIADYVITDYSAISIEAAILNKPTYFYLYDYDAYKHKNGLNIDLYKEMKGLCFEDFKLLYKNIEKNNYNYFRLKNYRNKYVTNQNGNAGFLIANYIVNGKWLS